MQISPSQLNPQNTTQESQACQGQFLESTRSFWHRSVVPNINKFGEETDTRNVADVVCHENT